MIDGSRGGSDKRGETACAESVVRSGPIRRRSGDGRAQGDDDRLVHRGPDDSGEYLEDHAALGFRRLSIIDLSGGHQPLANEDGTRLDRLQRRDLQLSRARRRLEAKGHQLRSTGDTEVLVHLYEDEGTRMFSLLRGMFALAIWDVRHRTLILARDRLGQKPLIYRHDGKRLLFASELKALLALPESNRSPPARSDRARSLPDLWLCSPAQDDPERNSQAAAGELCCLARGFALGRTVLAAGLEPQRETLRSRKTSRSCERLSTTPCASR